MSLGTTIFTLLNGTKVGQDDAGNIYYQERRKRAGALRQRRWVMYARGEEASAVPPEWHAWLHYTTDAPIPASARRPWQKPHLPNQTGTAGSYRPPGHDFAGGHRRPTTGDYEAWSPDA